MGKAVGNEQHALITEELVLEENRPQTKKAEQEEALVSVRASREQVEQLASLGVLSAAQIEAGRHSGGLEVLLPASLVAGWQQTNLVEAELARLARQIVDAGMTGPARLFLTAGRPLSFFGSQVLLMAQPVSRLAFGAKDPAGRYSTLLEDRRNVDKLLEQLDKLEVESRRSNPPGNPPGRARSRKSKIRGWGKLQPETRNPKLETDDKERRKL